MVGEQDSCLEQVTILDAALVESTPTPGKAPQKLPHLKFASVKAKNSAEAEYARQLRFFHEKGRGGNNRPLHVSRVYSEFGWNRSLYHQKEDIYYFNITDKMLPMI